ncbi:MAG: site-specific integrase, partial [Clostridiales bacterium]|nr:site-specific integrase [Clostridiales bacterium]
MDYRTEAPEVIREFLVYHETIKGHSKKTVDEYFLDLRTLFRYLKIKKGLVPYNTPIDKISIKDIDLDFVKTISLSDIYEYLAYLARDRARNIHSDQTKYGLSATTRARKIATIRSYFNYLTVKTKQLEVNPVADLDSPKAKKTLPRFLSLEESTKL